MAAATRSWANNAREVRKLDWVRCRGLNSMAKLSPAIQLLPKRHGNPRWRNFLRRLGVRSSHDASAARGFATGDCSSSKRGAKWRQVCDGACADRLGAPDRPLSSARSAFASSDDGAGGAVIPSTDFEGAAGIGRAFGLSPGVLPIAVGDLSLLCASAEPGLRTLLRREVTPTHNTKIKMPTAAKAYGVRARIGNRTMNCARRRERLSGFDAESCTPQVCSSLRLCSSDASRKSTH